MKTAGLHWLARALRLPITPEPPPRRLGTREGRLRACPPTPNCVCSQDPDPARRVSPLPGQDGREATMARVRTMLDRWPGACVAAESTGYLHAEFETPVLRFIDDVELLWDADEQVLHVRSASRLGRNDFGVNRRRVEELRSRLETTNGPLS